MMKLLVRLFVMFVVLTISAQSVVNAADKNSKQIAVTKGGVAIMVNGEELFFARSQFPFTYQGTTYLPLRVITEALGKNVELNLKTSTITLSGTFDYEADYSGYSNPNPYQQKISVQFIQLHIVNDGKALPKEIKAIFYDNRTYLPVRALVDAVGATLEWDQQYSEIYIYKHVPIPNVTTQIIKSEVFIRSVIDEGEGFLNSYNNLAPSIVTFVEQDGTVNVGFEDEVNDTLNITAFSADLKPGNTILIKKEMPLFGTFTKDDQGNFYVLWGLEVKEGEKDRASVKISKYSNAGIKLGDVSFKAGEQYKGTLLPFAFANAKLKYDNGLLVAFFGRLMFQSEDGVNHQSSTALYVETATMQQKTLFIPYSSHSFDQDIAFDGDNIVFAERGDVYDRGFVISKFNQIKEEFNSVTPFNFKFGSAIYQLTFSELGGLAVADDGYVLVGTSEKTMSAETAKEAHNESRNLFLQLIAKNYEELEQPVLSIGDTQTFKVSLEGNTYNASNTGVVWLTDYRNKAFDNAAHPKVVQIASHRFLILWEKMGLKKADSSYMDYKTTYYMVVSSKGQIVKPATEIKGARINIGDFITYRDGAVYWAANTAEGVIVYKLSNLE